MAERCDVVVVGCGGIGSACLSAVARRGAHVVGIDPYPTAHDRGSSHGETRIIRQAYFEHPDYVPLLFEAYEGWRRLEDASGRTLMELCGLLLAGAPSGPTIRGARLAAQQHRLRLDEVQLERPGRMFRGFQVPEGFAALFEPMAGLLYVERCIRAHTAEAIRRGATKYAGEAVVGWTSDSGGVRVHTERRELHAGSLVLTPGAWAPSLSADLAGLPELRVLRKVLCWCPTQAPHFSLAEGGSGFFFEMPYGDFYGFPSIDGRTIKLAEHSGGEPVSDPAELDRAARPDDARQVGRFLGEVMPEVGPAAERTAVCMYTMTPDGHFVVDTDPAHPDVHFAVGLSGHGYKFASVLGEVLADLALNRSTDRPIEFLGLRRFRSSGR